MVIFRTRPEHNPPKPRFKTLEISNPAYENKQLAFITVKTPNSKGRGDICVYAATRYRVWRYFTYSYFVSTELRQRMELALKFGCAHKGT